MSGPGTWLVCVHGTLLHGIAVTWLGSGPGTWHGWLALLTEPALLNILEPIIGMSYK